MQYAYQGVLTNANLMLHIGENRFEHASFSETLKPVTGGPRRVSPLRINGRGLGD
jgi:hypothetical protein